MDSRKLQETIGTTRRGVVGVALALTALARLGAGCAAPTSAAPAATSGAAAAGRAGPTDADVPAADAPADPDAATKPGALETGGAAPLDMAPSAETGAAATQDAGQPDTGKGRAAAVCGDVFCAESETCQTCPYDCGKCKIICGDGSCDGNESCKTCKADCGACPPPCPDGFCASDESCVLCPADCGACPADCGNAACEKGESCETCAADCGPCSTTPCDPLTGQGCKPTEQCYEGYEVPVCLQPGPNAKGAPCKAYVSCAKGLLCVNATCLVACDPAGVAPLPKCPAGLKCGKVTAVGKSGVCM